MITSSATKMKIQIAMSRRTHIKKLESKNIEIKIKN